MLMWLATRVGIPWLRERVPGPDILCWFLAGGAVFAGLFLASLVAFCIERRSVTLAGFAARFRFRRVSRGDVLYPVTALAACGAASGVIFAAWTCIAASTGLLDAPALSPPFVHMEPLTARTLWVLAAWLPLFVFNIAGEELWWRGYMLPRQERQHGKWAWLVHGAGLTLFHLPLGVDLAIILLPLLGALPWVVQRRQNLWCGFIFHGLLNGGGFLAVAFGLA
jgi:membrane protease YdiL (CAAX protease family)